MLYREPAASQEITEEHEIATKPWELPTTFDHVIVAADAAGVRAAKTPKVLTAATVIRDASITENRLGLIRRSPLCGTTPRTVFDMSPLPP
jgi:hypothetical protein